LKEKKHEKEEEILNNLKELEGKKVKKEGREEEDAYWALAEVK
jgi:hypothetical protein